MTVIAITVTAQQQSSYAVVGDFFRIKTPPVDKKALAIVAPSRKILAEEESS